VAPGRADQLAEFLAANGLSADDFEQLVIVDEKVRWACARAERDALDDLLDDLPIGSPQSVWTATGYSETVSSCSSGVGLRPRAVIRAWPSRAASRSAAVSTAATASAPTSSRNRQAISPSSR